MNYKKYLPVAFLASLPLVFSLVFFGYLPLRFDAIIYTSNIIGEGTCSSYLTDTQKSFAYLYKGDAYFGSELKTLRLVDLPINVETVGLYIYNIEEADIVSFDISMFGRTVAHVNKDGLTHPFTLTPKEAVSADEEPITHLVVEDGEEETSVSFPGNSIIPIQVWATYFSLIIGLSILLSFGLTYLFSRVQNTELPVIGASSIMTTVIMGCFLCGSLPYVSYTDFLLNWIILLAVALLVNSVTLPWIGTILVSAITTTWYIANCYVIQFRSKPIMPADLKAIKTAREVIGGYDLTPTWQIIVNLVVILIYSAVVIIVWAKNRPKEKTSIKREIISRAVGIIVAITLIFISVNNPAFDKLNTFQWDAKVLEGFHREGIVLTFIKSAFSAHVDKPEGYSRELVESWLNDYQQDNEPGDAVHPTRIIMVMNEAFSDLRTVGLYEDIDVMPFIDSLNDNIIEGSLYVSVIGGGTCNTEFEALTGNSLAFLGSGAYPYTENVTEPMFSLASYLRDNGYITEAFHANEADNWNRKMVYPNLGFEKFHSIDDYIEFGKITTLHNYPADISDYLYIEGTDDLYNNQPRFLFNVTMQNHSPYDRWMDVEKAASVEEYGQNLYVDTQVYLSLIKASDDEVRQLIEMYKDSDEPTMIVFFGDHQPCLPSNAMGEIYTDVQANIDLYKTKFFIWTNYDTTESHNTAISANYLPWLILERGNFPLPPYVNMLKELYGRYPIISSQGVMDLDGNVYDSVTEVMDDPLIQKYQYIQYANMFDEIDPAWFKLPEDDNANE